MTWLDDVAAPETRELRRSLKWTQIALDHAHNRAEQLDAELAGMKVRYGLAVFALVVIVAALALRIAGVTL